MRKIDDVPRRLLAQAGSRRLDRIQHPLQPVIVDPLVQRISDPAVSVNQEIDRSRIERLFFQHLVPVGDNPPVVRLVQRIGLQNLQDLVAGRRRLERLVFRTPYETVVQITVVGIRQSRIAGQITGEKRRVIVRGSAVDRFPEDRVVIRGLCPHRILLRRSGQNPCKHQHRQRENNSSHIFIFHP